MKRLLCALLAAVIFLTLVSCNDGEGDGYKSYTEGNLSFRLPDTLTKKNVSYADVYYSDGEMYLIIMAFSNQKISEELELYEDITVTDYVNLFQTWNGYNATYYYDEERNCVQFDEISSFEDEYSSSVEYEYYLFFRRDNGIYVLCLGCDASLKGKYEEIFKYIDSTVIVE